MRGNSINLVSPNSMYLCKNVTVFNVVLCNKINTFSITGHIEVHWYIHSVILDVAISLSILSRADMPLEVYVDLSLNVQYEYFIWCERCWLLNKYVMVSFVLIIHKHRGHNCSQSIIKNFLVTCAFAKKKTRLDY